MNSSFRIIIFSFLLISACKTKIQKKSDATNLAQANFTTIAFGSCNKQNKDQPLWKDIGSEDSKLWIWLGDNIYSDTEDMKILEANYAKQNAHPAYQSFKQKMPIIGTWDDHDYGENDGDKNFPKKKESKKLALDFLDVPKDAKVRNREGMFQSFEYNFSGKKVRIILLDTRYFRDAIERKNKKSPYIPDPDADMLGQAQWEWLEEELKKEEDILIIGGGTQFLPEEHRFEKWANFPTSRQRFLSLLEKEETENIILISGDRHIGEISKMELSNKSLHEITSSGLTHSYTKFEGENNRYRIGEVTAQLNYGLIRIYRDGKIELILSGRDRQRHLSVFL